MRVPILSAPVLRLRLHRDRDSVWKRSPAINISQEWSDDEDEFTMEDDMELDLTFMEDDSDFSTEPPWESVTELM
jgi:hypothetical protein